jgi:flavin-dependent dehydrogenase
MRQQPLIIGGGPAGCAAAIRLAQAGFPPIVVERNAGPVDKVCGDFISADTIRQLRTLGVDPAALGGAAIDRVRLIHGDRVAETPLPFPALGLSRRVLDAALLARAHQQGATIRTGSAVRHLTRDAGHWSAAIGNQTLQATTVFLATGKHDLRDLPRPRTDQGAVGMKMYYHLDPEAERRLAGATELTLFPGGYAGLQPVEAGRTVLCIALRRATFQSIGGWPGLLRTVTGGSPRFAAMLAGAHPLLPRPLAVAGVPYGYQAAQPGLPGLFRLGDQAAVIPSLTGDGMAIALHSGIAAAEAWFAGADAAAYQRGLAQTLAPQMRLAGWLHRACLNGRLQPVAARLAGLFPGMLRQAATQTRLRPAIAL